MNNSDANNQLYSNQAEEIALLKAKVDRLKLIVNALMVDYNTIVEANFRTGDVNILRLDRSVFDIFGTLKKLPLYDDLLAIYIERCVWEEDKDGVKAIMDKKFFSEYLQYGSSVTHEHRNNFGVYGEIKIVRIDEDSVLLGFTDKDREITERNQQLYTDPLTNVKNRKYYNDYFAFKPCHALVMADIDYFKNINDSYGHLCGDKALSKVAATIRSSVRKEDRVIRYGGDEFLIAFSSISQRSLAERLETVRQAVENIRLENYPDLRLSMSFGAAYGNTLSKDMLSTADKLLYEAKKKKNCVIIEPFRIKGPNR